MLITITLLLSKYMTSIKIMIFFQSSLFPTEMKTYRKSIINDDTHNLITQNYLKLNSLQINDIL